MNDGSLAFDIAASGMAAERGSMNVIAENLANASTVRGPSGEPYRSRYAVFEPAAPFSDAMQSALGPQADDFSIALDDDTLAPQGVRLASVLQAPREYAYRFDPGNPLAEHSGARKGYVAEPSVDSISQMVDLIAAGRAYDADVAVLQGAKQMDLEAADIDR